jgi:hypothetical protein
MQEGIERSHQVQTEYLDTFRRQVIDEAKPLDGTFTARAELYGASAWGATQEAIRTAAGKVGIFTEEMAEHRGKDEPCDTCTERIAQGWQPIGTLRSIGDSTCVSRCHCTLVFRDGPDGVPHVAGRGPLHEAAFGRTG